MTTFPDVLLNAPNGSCAFLDAVVATMDTMTDRQFAALLRRRERLHETDAETLRFEAALRDKCKPLSEAKTKRVPLAKRTRPVAVVEPKDKWRRISSLQYAGRPWNGEEL